MYYLIYEKKLLIGEKAMRRLIGIIAFMTFLLFTAKSLTLFAGWSAPVNISKPGVVVARTALAVDTAGNAVAGWERIQGSKVIQTSITTGGSWSQFVDISDPLTATNIQVSLGIDAIGNAVAVWNNPVGATIRAGILEFAEEWSSPPGQDISPLGDKANSQKVSMEPNGSAVAVWVRTEMQESFIEGAFKTSDSSTFSPSVVISGLDPLEPASSPDVSIVGSGNAVAVWIKFDGFDYLVQAAILPNLGVWSAPVNLSLTGQNAASPKVDMNFSGYAVAIWSRFNGTHNVIQASTLQFGGHWSPAINVSDPIKADSLFPVVMVDSEGTAIALWQAFDGSNFVIQSSTLPFNGFWTDPVAISSPTSDIGNPRLALNNEDQAVAVWRFNNGTNSIIQAAVTRLGGAWSLPMKISLRKKDASEPEVGIDGNGNAIAIWVNETNSVIQGSRGTHLFPEPPSKFMGKVIKNKFFTQTDRIHQLTWTPSSDKTVVAYKIFRNGQLIATIPASCAFLYNDHNRSINVSDTYVLLAVNAFGTESTSLTVTLK